MKVLRTKSIEQSLEDTEDVEFKLKKELSALDLTVFGIGVVIGAGIFTLTGRVANQYAGPGVVFSFAIAIKESLRVNLFLVAIKLFIVLFVIIAGLFYVSGANYHPFIPPAADPIDSSGLTQPLLQVIFEIG